MKESQRKAIWANTKRNDKKEIAFIKYFLKTHSPHCQECINASGGKNCNICGRVIHGRERSFDGHVLSNAYNTGSPRDYQTLPKNKREFFEKRPLKNYREFE